MPNEYQRGLYEAAAIASKHAEAIASLVDEAKKRCFFSAAERQQEVLVEVLRVQRDILLRANCD